MKKFGFLSLVFISLSIAACNIDTSTDSANQSATPTVKKLAQEDLQNVLKQDDVVLIDVRTPSEVSEGYISDADKFIDYNGADFKKEIQQLDTNKTYVMYCRSGGRSGNASEYMIQNGFKDVYNLQGGINMYQGSLKKP